MNSLQHQENVIAINKRSRHDIKKYEFKPLGSEEDSSLAKIADLPPLEPVETPQDKEQETTAKVNDTPPVQVESSIQVELIEKLLEQNERLEKSIEDILAKQDKQQEEMEKILREAKEESRLQGVQEGEQKARAELQEQVNAQIQALGDSIAHLGQTSLKLEEQIGNIEKDLSIVALDIAKEVIAKEVSEQSSQIALSLSRRLLDSLKDATKILVKLNPDDYASLVAEFDNDDKITLEADKSIARGGVVVISDNGNLDGTIMSRFENLKRSILEGQG